MTEDTAGVAGAGDRTTNADGAVDPGTSGTRVSGLSLVLGRDDTAHHIGRAQTRLDGELPLQEGAEPVHVAARTVERSGCGDLWVGDGGSVALVGAGPGDPGLLTVRAWRLLHSADVVLYDSLTSSAIVRSLYGCECIDVGKRTDPRTTQDQIHELMLERATAGDRVVRLKGGDPVVFGRGGEEAAYLAEQSVPFRVVPGVTSVVAAPELAGIPVTHRDISSSFTVITGHEAAGKTESHLDWDALAQRVTGGETLIVLMGVKRLPEYVRRLQDRGVPGTVPVAMIEKVTWEAQQTVTGTLGTIVDRADAAGIAPPATTVIGEVVSMRQREPDVNWADGTRR